MTVLRRTTRTCRGRMRRRCNACCLPIIAGDRYIDSAFVGDDGPYSWVEHDVCDRAVANWDASDPSGEGLPEGYLQDRASVLLEPDDEITPEWRAWYAARIAAAQEGWLAPPVRSVTPRL